MRSVAVLAALALVTACVSTDVTPLSRSQFVISSSAAPACGVSGARRVVTRMAAVHTLRSGYDRFLIEGGDARNNVSVVQTPPTSAYTTGQVTTYGNTAYGSATTTYSGGGVIYSGSNDADMLVRMLQPGDLDYDNGVDAREFLGPDWQQLVQDGIQTCG